MKGCLLIISLSLVASGCSLLDKPTKKDKDLGYVETRKIANGKYFATQVFDELMADTTVTFKSAKGWSMAEKIDQGVKVSWTFPPSEHPAYPAVIKRIFMQVDGQLDIATTVHCAADRAICDELVKQFISINEKLKANAAKAR